MIFFGCTEDNPVASEINQTDQLNNQSDQVVECRIRPRTPFNGISTFTANLATGTVTQLPNGNIRVKGKINEWYDDSSDPRVTGKTIWYINAIIYPDGHRKLWGRGELFVDNNGGYWKMRWHGTMSPDGSIVDYVVGRGKEGPVKGLRCKSTYISVPDPNEPPGFYYTLNGYIIEKKKNH